MAKEAPADGEKDTRQSLVETDIPIPDFVYDIRSTIPLVGRH